MKIQFESKFRNEVITAIKEKGYTVEYDKTWDLFEVYTPKQVYVMAFIADKKVSFIETEDKKYPFNFTYWNGIPPKEIAQSIQNHSE
ncbi:hypothetical protein [Salinicoccus kekensis]|uniref:Uncharacterized protein n=1 Tax=Salinicoccus kekensis TaxID=714307 RepID=A0A285UTG6_9STAP|nr:hypothetical protein [Salinicoccus kekensis]SOC45093.1 hypothetical protein SAMN05878391_2599 [Salinicoccus kekensis]